MKLSLITEQNYAQSNFKRGKITCPVCDKTHHYHCSVTEDGGLAVCRNKWSERQAKDGRYIHILTPTNYKVGSTSSVSNGKNDEVSPADADRLHASYSTLLSHLRLTPAHAASLLDERGLSDTTIAYHLYASVPDEHRGNHLARAMAKLGVDLKGVPGFYFKGGHWRLNTRYKGFFVPYRDKQGRIVGLQIRRDGNAQPKYVWLSSRDLPEGTPASSCVHFSKPDLAERSSEVLITEGALKASRISEFSDLPAVAIAGVTATNPETIVSRLREAFPRLKRVVIGFDMDWQTNVNVRSAIRRLLQTLKATSLEVVGRKWDMASGKGLDDALFSAMGRTA